MTAEAYISVDVETDGPIPGVYSMLSIGAAEMRRDGSVAAVFSENLLPLPGAKEDPDTIAWWSKHPEAYAQATKDAKNPEWVMQRFAKWLENRLGSPVFVGYPASYDFMFTYWYLMRFVGHSPFGFHALDMKTLAMVKLGLPFRKTTRKNMPGEWFDPGDKNSHHALSDAIEQGRMFLKMDAFTPQVGMTPDELQHAANRVDARKRLERLAIDAAIGLGDVESEQLRDAALHCRETHGD